MDPLLLQLADSAFPVGGFVHSAGLEAAVQAGVLDAGGLASWLHDALWQAGHVQLPLVAAAWDGGDLAHLDDLAEALTSTVPANRASRAQGSAWIATAAAVFAGERPALAELKRALRAGRWRGHAAPAFGRVCALLGVAREDCRGLFLFCHLRTLASVAVRLGLVGPLEAQRIQAGLAGVQAAVLAACAGLGPDDCTATAVVHDLAHAQHDRLYSRLFAT